MEYRPLWFEAYAHIYPNKGALTPGVNKSTMDDFFDERVDACVCQGKTRPFDTLKVGHVITRPSAACHVKSDRRLSTVSRVVPVPRGLPAVS